MTDSKVTGGIGRAVVGGVLAGDVGAFVGAMTAPEKIVSYKIVIYKNNPANHPEDEKLNEELNTLVSDMRNAFGHLENFLFKLLEIDNKAHINRAHYSIKEHISMLKKLGEDMLEKRRQRNSFARNEYLRAVSATMPNDGLKQAIINLILDRYIAEHKELPFGLCREKYGIWVNGWNEERQEPNVIAALHSLPLEVIMKQKHNIDGFPKEYYIRKKKTD